MKNRTTRRICLTALMAAIIYVFTAYIHVPSHTGYTHVGDGFLDLAASLLPAPFAAAAGAIGAGLAAVAALMYIAQYPKVYTTMGATLGIYAFVAAVLGGIGSLPGAMLGGLLIGIVQSGANTYISSSMSDTFVYLILIVVLMLRPAGILGKNVGEKV